MKIAGFTFIRNAVNNDYPIVEAIQSILPICDEFVVAVGRSDDGTLELIKSIESPKLRIIETIWNLSIREGGRFLLKKRIRLMMRFRMIWTGSSIYKATNVYMKNISLLLKMR